MLTTLNMDQAWLYDRCLVKVSVIVPNFVSNGRVSADSFVDVCGSKLDINIFNHGETCNDL